MIHEKISVDCASRMIEAIRRFGIIPFFRNKIPGWSIEELTAAGHWFGSEEDGGSLGPWDWKIEAVREGDIAYGKFLGAKAAFATVEWYRHLMNWRRSIPKYNMVYRNGYQALNHNEKLAKILSPTLLDALNESGSLESRDIRKILKERTSREELSTVGGCMEKYLIPEIKKQAVDSLLQFMEMGTWTVIGDFTRVYKGPNLEYKGWQRSSVTTPDELFRSFETGDQEPFWAKYINESPSGMLEVTETPEQSREILTAHIVDICGEEYRKIAESLI